MESPETHPGPTLTSGSRLARNSILNLLGLGLPLLAALFAIPVLIEGLGTDRFGILTLAWMVIGYFGFFDLGLGRALTQVVAERLARGADASHASPIWPALGVMLVLGAAGAGVVVLAAPALVYSILEVPTELRPEAVRAFHVLAAGLPLVVFTAGLVGILAAHQRFGAINAIRAPMAIFSLLAPVAVLPFSQSLVAVTGALVVGRLLACGANLLACKDVLPPLRGAAAGLASLRTVFRFGAWITVSNLISPLLVYLDRFVIGALLSVSAVTYYATPYEVITRFLVVPGALVAVLFPAFAETHRQSHERTVRIFASGAKWIILSLFPVMLLAVSFAEEGLTLWIGEEFARRSSVVLRLLAVGVFVNGAAQAAFTLVQGIGRPDVTARLHLLELPIYVPALFWGIDRFGITGAAAVWTGRVAVDAALLYWQCQRMYSEHSGIFGRIGLGLGAGIAVALLPLTVPASVPRAAVVTLLLVCFVPVAWKWLLADHERAAVGRILSAAGG